MVRQVAWNKVIFEAFMEESFINRRIELGDIKAKEMYDIMEKRIAGWSIEKYHMETGLSIKVINENIKELKQLYDSTQKYSKILPPRTNLTKWEVRNMNGRKRKKSSE